MTAAPAFAHHPEISARAVCAVDGSYLVSYTATAWQSDDPSSRTNPDVRISVVVGDAAAVEKDRGAFVAPDFSFSGQFTVPSTATSVVVTAFTAAPWGNGFPGGQTTSTPPLDLPPDCGSPPPPPPGDDGCTPGYWQNHLGAWAGTGYSPSQTPASVFSNARAYGLGSKTLLQSLEGGGGRGTTGAAKILLRAGTAALLNASHGGVEYTRGAADVIADVNAALASNNRDTMLALAGALDADNNLGCPLN